MKRHRLPGDRAYPAFNLTSLRHGTGGPAGMELQPAITGYTCDYCGLPIAVSCLVSGGKRVCNEKKCRLAHGRAMRKAEAVV